MSIRRVPFPEWPPEQSGPGRCRWCGEIVRHRSGKREGLINTRAHWHRECLEDFYLHSRLEQQFGYVERRDGLKCAWPGCGAEPAKWHNLGECVEMRTDRPSFLWAGPVGSDAWLAASHAWSRENPNNRYTMVERRTALELDHRYPLWAVQHLDPDRRRPFYGPRNLWLLCPEHHKAKTAREAALRADLKAGRLSRNQVIEALKTGLGVSA